MLFTLKFDGFKVQAQKKKTEMESESKLSDRSDWN